MAVTELKGDYAFLSNFYPSPITRDGITYPTIEHFFQAHKTEWIEEHLHIAECESPGEAKALGRSIELRDDWEEVKYQVMFTGVMLKFLSQQSLGQKLTDTGNAHLYEGNHWGDTTWGVIWDSSKQEWVGQNWLGEILMDVRSIIRGLR